MAAVVVTGPPNSGKTTWVRDRAKLHDLVWDFDKLVSLIAGAGHNLRYEMLPPHVIGLMRALRQAFIDYAATAPLAHSTVYVIATNPTDAERLAGVLDADIVELGR